VQFGRDDITENSLSDERSVKILDRPLTVAAHAEWVGHVARAILAQVERVLAVMRVVGVTVRDNHLGERDTPEYLHIGQPCSLSEFSWKCTHRPHVAAIVEGDVRQDDTLTVVESNVEVPLLPVDGPAVHFE
jgi:hypothetical protein